MVIKIVTQNFLHSLPYHPHLSLCVRYVTADFMIQERFLGFWSTATTDGATLFNLLKDVLQSLGLFLNQVHAQCYDGVANMRGS